MHSLPFCSVQSSRGWDKPPSCLQCWVSILSYINKDDNEDDNNNSIGSSSSSSSNGSGSSINNDNNDKRL